MSNAVKIKSALSSIAQGRLPLAAVVASVLFCGFCGDSWAQASSSAAASFNDGRIHNYAGTLLTYIEGSGSALMLMIAGCGCILAAMSRRYWLALFLLGVGAGCFLTRSVVHTFFFDVVVPS